MHTLFQNVAKMTQCLLTMYRNISKHIILKDIVLKKEGIVKIIELVRPIDSGIQISQ